ncbi:hypothetical protein DMC61_15010 [Amycolatopsis sp. WAC 04169]|uniref:hypothetical protein n=1 Tax=Amycolatopsis sp. WAC 04169 TaxID=2203197 RepID=UPI000F7AA56E|nr:hypothetical protein [Amycolatopsis sp. WAC 04169]RSN31452.1 hypothetical protein DMC61_15010 [Amycolatopsis sp. WAC 04169]
MRKLVTTAIAVTAFLTGSPALAEPGGLDLTVTQAGFAAPSTVRAGVLTLAVRSEDPAGAWVGLVRLRPGVALETYARHLKQAMSDDPADVMAGGRAVTADAEMFGGVAVITVPAAAEIAVSPGDYHLVDFRDVAEPDFLSRIRPLRIGPGTSPNATKATAAIIATDNGFLAPHTLASGAPVFVLNASGQFTEAMLLPVRPGTALADLDAFFARTGPSPFTGRPTGVVPLSPWRSAILTTALPPGEYALVTWVRDLRTGEPLALRGARALVRVA